MTEDDFDVVSFLTKRAETADAAAEGQEREAEEAEAEAARLREGVAMYRARAAKYRDAAETLKIANAGVERALSALGVT